MKTAPMLCLGLSSMEKKGCKGPRKQGEKKGSPLSNPNTMCFLQRHLGASYTDCFHEKKKKRTSPKNPTDCTAAVNVMKLQNTAPSKENCINKWSDEGRAGEHSQVPHLTAWPQLPGQPGHPSSASLQPTHTDWVGVPELGIAAAHTHGLGRGA